MFKKKIRLDVRIRRVYQNDEKYVVFEVWIENHGTADALFVFVNAKFTAIRSDEATEDLSIKGETITTQGLYSIKKRWTGRLRPDCSIRMPYYLKLTEESKGKLHLVEFDIPVEFGNKTIIHIDRILIEL